MKKRITALFGTATLILASALFAASASAGIIKWSAELDPGQEVGPLNLNGATPRGWASGKVNDKARKDGTFRLSWKLNWEGLTGGPRAAHFHRGLPGVNGPVEVGLNLGNNPGSDGKNNGNAFISRQQLDDLLAGLWYLNIHTAANPGGEIRGQIGTGKPARIPEPATFGLLAAGALGFFLRPFTRRRRR